jgi:hypothetical protein
MTEEMNGVIESQELGTSIVESTTIFSPETKAVCLSMLASLENDAFEAVSYFLKGQFGRTQGVVLDLKSTFIPFAETCLSKIQEPKTPIEKMKLVHDLTNELGSSLKESKIIPLVKAACGVKDNVKALLEQHTFIAKLSSFDAVQLKALDIVELAKYVSTQYEQAMSIIGNGTPVESICKDITSVENIYDGNVDKMVDAIEAVVHYVAFPTSLFDLSDSTALESA